MLQTYKKAKKTILEYCKHYSDIYLIFKYLVTALLITPHVRYTS